MKQPSTGLAGQTPHVRVWPARLTSFLHTAKTQTVGGLGIGTRLVSNEGVAAGCWPLVYRYTLLASLEMELLLMLCLLLSVFVAAYLLWPKKRSIDVRKFCRKYSDEKVSVMCNSCFNKFLVLLWGQAGNPLTYPCPFLLVHGLSPKCSKVTLSCNLHFRGGHLRITKGNLLSWLFLLHSRFFSQSVTLC